VGVEQLSALAARLRAIPTLGPEIARAAAPGVLEAVQKTAAEGTTPDGNAWAPRKKDGARALVNAAAALSVRVVGDVVIVVLSGVNVFQQKRRNILPTYVKDIPKPLLDAIRTAAVAVLARPT
jgi:hypothetical protein